MKKMSVTEQAGLHVLRMFKEGNTTHAKPFDWPGNPKLERQAGPDR